MPQITVRFYTTLKEKVEKRSVFIKADTMAKALEELNKQFGSRVIHQLYSPDGTLENYYTLVLSGHVVNHRDIKKTNLKEGDVIHIFPPIAGG